ncbi:hypothetical protein [Kitasatospora sp. NBC_01266]|uniref:hypothetical protein n=1 Tax=Kitasatospora sp. NBC_01266 TaxID=2903572 RepID=UPI002E32A0A1|nr:hypothetical protein [Kitasatospora sp. NBC_01266]
MTTILGIQKAAEQTARILDDSAFQAALKAGRDMERALKKHASLTAYSQAVDANLRALTTGLDALGRTWTSELDRLLDSTTLKDLNTLATVAAESPLTDWEPAAARSGLLGLYDGLGAQDFQHPLLSPENIQTARKVIASAPETGPAKLPDVQLSTEVADRVGDLVADLAEHAKGSDRQKRATNIGTAVTLLFLTVTALGYQLLPELLERGLEVADVLTLAYMIRAFAISKYLEMATDDES